MRRHQTASLHSLLFCMDVDIYACFVTEIHLLCQDDEEEGIVVYPGSPTSTKSLSPRRLQKMRRVWHWHTHISKWVNYIYTDWLQQSSLSLDQNGFSVFPLNSFQSTPSPPHLSDSPPSLVLPQLSVSLVASLRSTVVCQGAKCNDKHFFLVQCARVVHSVFSSEQHGQSNQLICWSAFPLKNLLVHHKC